MEVKAKHKNARMSAQKVRLVRNVVLGLPVLEAEAQLQYLPGKAAQIVLGVLKSAVANAVHNFEIEKENLKVADVVVDEGLVMKRIRPVSRGMAHGILKRMSHVTVVVEETGETKKERIGKKHKIKTITTEELMKQAAEDAHNEEGHHDHDKETKKPERGVEEQAFQKTKTQNKGGDRAQTHRRKSLKGD